VGVVCAPTAIANDVCLQYRVRLVGTTDAVRERFYAITVERRIKHPAIAAITESAQRDLFA
jgi:LysR family transcriptional activator of nhaA